MCFFLRTDFFYEPLIIYSEIIKIHRKQRHSFSLKIIQHFEGMLVLNRTNTLSFLWSHYSFLIHNLHILLVLLILHIFISKNLGRNILILMNKLWQSSKTTYFITFGTFHIIRLFLLSFLFYAFIFCMFF